MALADVWVSLNGTVAGMQEQFNSAALTVDRLGKTVVDNSARMSESSIVAGDALKREAESAIASSNEIAASLDKSSISAARMAAGIDAAAAQSAFALDKLAVQVQADMIKMSMAEDKAIASNEKLGTSSDETGNKSSSALQKMAGKFALAGVAVGALGGIAVDMAAKYQTLTTRLVTSAGESQNAIKSVSDGMLNMAGQVGMAADQLASGMYIVESAGYHGAQGLTVLKAAAQGAKAEGADLTIVADAVSTALNDYHMPASAAADVTSKLIAAVGQGKTTMQDFSGALHSVTPLAASMGISLADVTGSLAEMTAHGMSADQASQNLAETLRTLQKPSTQATAALAQIGWTVNEVQDSLKNNGMQQTLEQISQTIINKMGPAGTVLLNAFNTSRQAAQNLAEALKVAPPAVAKLGQSLVDGSMSFGDYRKAVKGLPADMQPLATGFMAMQQNASGFTNTLKAGGPQALTFNQMLQQVTGNATTMNTALMLTGENAAGATDNIEKISGATADASGNVKGFADVQQTFNQKLDEAKAGFGAMAIKVGEVFLPALTKVAGVLATVFTWLSQHQAVAMTLAAVIGALTVALLAAAAAMWVMSMTPIVLIIGAIVAGVVLLGFGLYELITHIKQVGAWFAWLGKEIATPFIEAYNTVKRFFVTMGNDIAHFFEALPGKVGDWFADIGASIRKGWDNAVAATEAFFANIGAKIAGFFTALPGEVWNWILGTGQALFNGYVNMVQATEAWLFNMGSRIASWFQNLPGRVAGWMGSVIAQTIGGWIGVYNGTVAWLSNMVGQVGAFFGSIPGRIMGVFAGAGGWLLGIGGQIIGGLWQGLHSAIDGVVQKIQSIGSSIVGAFKGVFHIGSPSKLMADEVGQHLPSGIAMGMLNNMGVVTKAAQAISNQAVMAALSGGMSVDMSLNGNASISGASALGSSAGLGSLGNQPPIVMNFYVAGNAVTTNDLVLDVQAGLAKLGQRNSVTYRPYKR